MNGVFFSAAGKSLVWVAILLVIIVYIYAVIAFAVFRTEFNSGTDGPGVFCDTLDQCLISVLRFGLIDNFLVWHYNRSF